jgi:deoxyribodipyrimidine photo-lyase
VAALGAHGSTRAEKFVQEVVWRAYFKGWLEGRPTVWSDYRTEVALFERSPEIAAAEAGETGIEAFDAWARELVDTGYLHNHGRMWFASIWVFTLGLPWPAGADFFLRHLLDGDPASNTCSWRWVAGLHTPGKTYTARPSNIAKYTEGRFADTQPRARHTTPPPGANPPRADLRAPLEPLPDVPSVRLITEEDLHPESLGGPSVLATATAQLTDLRSPRGVSRSVHLWDAAALADAAARAGGARAFVSPAPEQVADWADAAGARQVVTGYLPTGWVRDWADGLETALGERGIALVEQKRAYDAVIWPHARAGFFAVKKKIPLLLHELGF